MGSPTTFDWGGENLVVKSISFADGPGTTTLTSSATSGTISSFSAPLVVSGVGASVDGGNFNVTTAVALGTYANALNAKLDFGSAGRVTGLGAPMCAELDLGAGCTQGTYSVFEAELIMPTGAVTGTQTSFMIMDLSGAAAATFDTSGGIFSINGVTAGTTKAVASNGSIGNVNEITHGLRVFINGAAYYLLMASSADFVD